MRPGGNAYPPDRERARLRAAVIRRPKIDDRHCLTAAARRWRSNMKRLAIGILACRLAAVVAMFLATSAATGADTIQSIVAGVDKQIYLPAAVADLRGYCRAQGL